MKKYVLSVLVAAAFVSGCSQNSEPATGMTQAISESSVSVTESEAFSETMTSSEIAASESESPASSESAEPTTASTETADSSTVFNEGSNMGGTDYSADAENYYKVKAEKDAVELDIENLQAEYRVGELDKESFESRIRELRMEEERLDNEEDMLEDAIEFSRYRSDMALPEGDAETLFNEMSSLKDKERELELRERELESDYRAGNITRDEFVSSRTEDIREEEELDMREELLERALERMGYDD